MYPYRKTLKLPRKHTAIDQEYKKYRKENA